MRSILITCAAVSLASCNGLTKMDPATARAIIQEFHNAGCGGDFDLTAGASTGQLGGQANFSMTINAACPVGDIPVIPLRDLGKVTEPSS